MTRIGPRICLKVLSVQIWPKKSKRKCPKWPIVNCHALCYIGGLSANLNHLKSHVHTLLCHLHLDSDYLYSGTFFERPSKNSRKLKQNTTIKHCSRMRTACLETIRASSFSGHHQMSLERGVGTGSQVWCPGATGGRSVGLMSGGYLYHVAYPMMYLLGLLISEELLCNLNSFGIAMNRVILMTRLITQKYFTEYCYEIREIIWELPSSVKHKQLDMKRKQ